MMQLAGPCRMFDHLTASTICVRLSRCAPSVPSTHLSDPPACTMFLQEGESDLNVEKDFVRFSCYGHLYYAVDQKIAALSKKPPASDALGGMPYRCTQKVGI